MLRNFKCVLVNLPQESWQMCPGVISFIASLTFACSTAVDTVAWRVSLHRLALLNRSNEDNPGYGRLRWMVTGPNDLAKEFNFTFQFQHKMP